MPHYRVSKHLCLTLSTVKCGLVSECVTRASPNFFTNEILNFGTAVIFQFFHLFIQYIVKTFAFLRFFRKKFTLYGSRKIVWKLTVIQRSTVPHNSLQVSCAPKGLFCGFVFFLRTKWVSVNFASRKNSQIPWKLFYLPTQYLKHCKTYCFKSPQSW